MSGSPDQIELAVSSICRELRGSMQRLNWRSCADEDLYAELVGCMLGSQVPFKMAEAAVARLRAEGVLQEIASPRPRVGWTVRIARMLAKPLARTYPRSYRFPTLAAKRITRLRMELGGGLRTLLASHTDSATARRELVALRCGLGPKQASLFLRNISWSWDVAVLDSHVMRYMRRGQMTHAESAPSKLADYERLEAHLRAYAAGRGEPLGRFDLAVWVVMRAARHVGKA